jgi:hypothetical protein
MRQICPNCHSPLQRLDLDLVGAPSRAAGLFTMWKPTLNCPTCNAVLGISITPGGYMIGLLFVLTSGAFLWLFARYPWIQNSVGVVVGFFALAAIWVLCYARWGYRYKVKRNT